LAGGGGLNDPWTAVIPGGEYIGWVGTKVLCFGRLAGWQGTGRASSPEPVPAAGGGPREGMPGGIDSVVPPAAGLEVVVGGATVGGSCGGGGIFHAGPSDTGRLEFALVFEAPKKCTAAVSAL